MAGQEGIAEPGETPPASAMVRQERKAGEAAAQRRAGKTMGYLKSLAEELHARGLVARVLRARSGVAFVSVVNPVATTMRENVTCAPTPAGLHDWYYWWSWGECMHRVDDPAGAASKVVHVLETSAVPTG